MGKSKILAVDDNPVNLKLLSYTLERTGYDVSFAHNGVEACDMALKVQPDLILLDVMMPEKNGFEVCEELKANSITENIPVIFLTAKNDAVDKVRGLALGAVDYITKPFDTAEIMARVQAHLRIRNLHQQLIEKNCELEKAIKELHEKNERIDKDIKAAGMVQRQFLPQNISRIGSLNFAWKFVPSSHVAGDIFNIIQLDEKNLALFMVDVAGHGVQSAMLAISVYNFFRNNSNSLKNNQSLDSSNPFYFLMQPDKVAHALNQSFSMDIFDAYFTCIYMVINTETLQVKMVNAGHPFPIRLRNGAGFEFLEHGDIPIGMIQDVQFEVKEFKLERGESVILYTDGLYELQVNGSHEINKHILAQFFLEAPGNLSQRFDATMEKVLSLSDRKVFEDDVSLFGFEVL